MNEHNTVETFQPALFPLSAVQTSGYATPEPESDIDAVADDEAPQPTEDAA
jgi:hypothetical protein